MKKKRKQRSKDIPPRVERDRLVRGGWVAPLQGMQFAGLQAAVGEGSTGDVGAGSGGGEGGV